VKHSNRSRRGDEEMKGNEAQHGAGSAVSEPYRVRPPGLHPRAGNRAGRRRETGALQYWDQTLWRLRGTCRGPQPMVCLLWPAMKVATTD